MAIRIGTSGFIYEHWRRRFYPPSARGSELELYARIFDTTGAQLIDGEYDSPLPAERDEQHPGDWTEGRRN